jgi:hypothetical protein
LKKDCLSNFNKISMAQGSMLPWAGWFIALSLTLYVILHPFSCPHTCEHEVGARHSTVTHEKQNAPASLTKASFREWMAGQTPTLYHEAEWEKLSTLHGGAVGEGHMYTAQAQYYSSVARLPFVHTVCEIGFNGGHSATMWLRFHCPRGLSM